MSLHTLLTATVYQINTTAALKSTRCHVNLPQLGLDKGERDSFKAEDTAI